ncbi:MAG: flagella basal body P-ring formation protein FlgA [Candidatus Micrarchaeota archaeon]|nr:flagella basal body P-ring formation protein FlgA [Candidatus Micrarchaeota archaeon]
MNFNIRVFIGTFLVSFALALVVFALWPEADLMLLLKMLALALGITLLSPFWYPHARGVKKGDAVTIVSNTMGGWLRGEALEDGRLGQEIRVLTENNKEIKCKISSYAGTFSRAKVKVNDEEQIVEVR